MSKLRDKKWKKRGNSNKGQNGITLIALVITIIVLLILAGISIMMLTGDNSILKNATDAKEKTERASEKETITMAIIEIQTNLEDVNEANLQDAINNQIGNEKTLVVDNEDETFTVSFIDSKRNYRVNTKNQNIEEIEEGTDIFVAFYASNGILRFATKKDALPSINEENGDIYYGNIKWKIYTSESFNGEDGIEHRKANTPWYEERENIVQVEILDEIVPTNTMNWFVGFTNMTSINLENMDTSKITDMSWMFLECSSLTSLNLINFDTSNVTTMFAMFYECRNIASLDIKNFDTSNVTDMQAMFGSCSNITSLDLSGFDTSKVTTMRSMFYNCNALTNLDISSFNTSNVVNVYRMFYKCSSLSVDCSGFDVQNVTNHTDFNKYALNVIEPTWIG